MLIHAGTGLHSDVTESHLATAGSFGASLSATTIMDGLNRHDDGDGLKDNPDTATGTHDRPLTTLSVPCTHQDACTMVTSIGNSMSCCHVRALVIIACYSYNPAGNKIFIQSKCHTALLLLPSKHCLKVVIQSQQQGGAKQVLQVLPKPEPPQPLTICTAGQSSVCMPST